MTITDAAGLAEFKQRTRATWAAGDFPEVAKSELWDVGARLVQRVGIGRGEQVLDVACGSGNAAIRAAQAGGRVTGVDPTPELFEAGRRLADESGVTVDWVEGDAEALPFEDETFDVVLSTFGAMFAPRHEVVAAELARVLRPGGRLGLCSWTPEGIQGEFFRTIGALVPPAPDFALLPWGSPEHVSKLFAGSGIALEFDRETVEGAAYGSDDALDFLSGNFGPLMMLRSMRESQGTWDGVRDQLASIYADHEPAEYLVALGRKL